MFWQNEDFSDQIILDGVICVVDGVFGLKVRKRGTRERATTKPHRFRSYNQITNLLADGQFVSISQNI